MKKFLGAAVLAGASVATAGAAHADEFSASVNFTSNYVFRGLTQTDGGAAVQASLDYSHDIFYAGIWGSNVNFGATSPTQTASMELDAYLGMRPVTGPINWDVGLIGYFYPNADDQVVGGEMDFGELAVSANVKPMEQLTLGAAVNYSPRFFADLGTAWYGEVNAHWAFSEQFSVSAAYGYQDVHDLGSYTTWNVGASYAVNGFQLGLTYSDTSDSALNHNFVFDPTSAGSQWSFSIGREL